MNNVPRSASIAPPTSRSSAPESADEQPTNSSAGRARPEWDPASRGDAHKLPGGRRIELGRRGEEAIAGLVEGWGWTLLDRNWSSRLGEIDIVAMDGSELAIIEVKTRSSLSFGHPAEAVDHRKLGRLRRLAGQWLSEHPGTRVNSVRIDIAAVVERGGAYECEYLQGVTL